MWADCSEINCYSGNGNGCSTPEWIRNNKYSEHIRMYVIRRLGQGERALFTVVRVQKLWFDLNNAFRKQGVFSNPTFESDFRSRGWSRDSGTSGKARSTIIDLHQRTSEPSNQ